MLRSLLILLLVYPSLIVAQTWNWSAESQLVNPRLKPNLTGSQSSASNGETWLTTWFDYSKGVVGTVIARDGSIAQVLPEPIGLRGGPAVAWNGERYLVASSNGISSTDLRWVDASGSPLGDPISLYPFGISGGTIASNGAEILLAGHLGKAVIVRPDGSRTALQDDRLADHITAATAVGRDFIVAGETYNSASTVLARITAEGAVQAAVPLAPLEGAELAWDGEHLWLAGKQKFADRAVVAHRLTPSLEIAETVHVADASARLLSVATLDGVVFLGLGRNPAPASELTLVRLDATGVSEEMPIASGATNLSITPSASSLLLAWSEGGTSVHQVWSASGPSSAQRFTVWRAAHHEEHALVAVNGAFLAAWEESDDWEQARLMIGRVRPSGATVGHQVAESSRWNYFSPAFATDGEIVLLGWMEPEPDGNRTRILLRRYTADLVPLDDEPLAIGDIWLSGGLSLQLNDNVFDLAWNGRQFVLAWTDYRDLRYVRITREGLRLDPDPLTVPRSTREGWDYPMPISPRNPQLAVSGDRTLLAWQASFPGESICAPTCGPQWPPPRIEGVRLDGDGYVLDAAPIVITQASDKLGQAYPVAVGVDGGFAVAYADDLTQTLKAVIVSVSGRVSFPFLVTPDRAVPEDMVRVGSDLFVLWRNVGSDADYGLRGRFIAPWGTWRSEVLPIAEDAFIYGGIPVRPNGALARDREGRLIVIYVKLQEDAGFVPRLWMRSMGEPLEQRRRPARRGIAP
jgi:hypothetical protein